MGYFWPDLKDNVALKQVNSHVYCKDINVFVDRVKDVIAYKGEEMVKANLQACLRGSSLSWFTSELSEFEKAALRSLPLAEEALNKVNVLRYTYGDVTAVSIAELGIPTSDP
ncbi:hypothetical protein EYZ11_013309 [Aspergillus tanneri]|uniref:Uncharacterized protein n=1 Tax=Aspergillus tanneri TaxID=1220188 RepID=A0A4S3IY27_9EURO|nr:hypothetical protein EYZ11_013309 [Aspergillus tanneri]